MDASLLSGASVLTAAQEPGGTGGGGIAVGWDATQWATINGLLGAQVTDYQWTDLLNTNEYTALQAGVVNPVQLAGSTGGVVRLGVGGTGYLFPAGMRNDAPPASAPTIVPFGNQRTVPWAMASRVRIPTAAAAGAHFYDLMDTSGITSGIGCGVRLNCNVSTTVLQVFQTGTNTACNAFGTLGGGNITVNQFFDVVVTWNPLTSTMTAAINGKVAAVVVGAANVPTEAAVVSCNCNVIGGEDVDAMLWAFGRMV